MDIDPDNKEIREGRILEGPYWPERVRVISVKKVGANLEIQAVGVRTDRFYSRILGKSNLKNVRVLDLHMRSFSGDAESFFLALEANRIRFAHQFDPLYAINVSKIDPLPHQIDAVYYHILKQPRIRFLLADDPGAGKTIMAGLVLKELKQRGIIERTLIVVPGHLIDQWRRELKEKFGETFRVVDRAVMDGSWGRHIWQDDNQLITSMDFAKQKDIMQSLAEVKWDLVIVDEAHKMAAYRYGGKLDKTERYTLGELISRNSDFLLFLTATPHRGDPENFRLLLDLLEPGFFATTHMLEESVKNKDNPLFLRRLKEDLHNFDGTPLFPPRRPVTIKYHLSDDEKKLYEAVTEYVEKYYQKAIDKDRRSVAFALIILQRRLASSVRAIRKSLERRINKLQELLKAPAFGSVPEELRYMNEEELEDRPEAERWRIEDDLSERLTVAENLDELKQEIIKLQELVRLASEAEKKEIETKLNELRKVIESEKLKQTGEKLLIFTEFRDTLEYLVEKLKSWGFSVCYIHGAQKLDERVAAENEFNQTATQIMVSTEAGGEGINLQFHCCLMVNYDIPWNPNRLEQRMGRIHRYGQRYEVHIYNLVAVDTREGKILSTLFDKLKIISEQLGSDRVYDVIGTVVGGRNLKDLITEAITNKRSIDDILKDFERITDKESIMKLKEVIMEGLAVKYIDLTRIIGEMRLAKENRLVPEYIERFFMRAANKLGLEVEQRSDQLYRIQNIPYEIRKVPYEFKLKYGEPYREYNKFSFIKDEAIKKQAEFIAPGHPLLEAIVDKVLMNYGQDLEKGATFTDPSGSLEGLLWFIEAEINDGNGDVAGKRIFALYQSINKEIRPVSPSILWDLKPDGSSIPEELLSLANKEDDIISYTVDQVLPAYLEELRKRREQSAEVKRKYGLRSLEYLINESERKLGHYEYRKVLGEDMDIAIQSERIRKEDLIKRKKQLEKQIEAETHLLLSRPKIIGVAAVLPRPASDELRENKEVESIGIKVAMEYEISHNRMPEDVSSQNLGYDIRSGDKEGRIRYIEVKARAKDGRIAFTSNEWLMAKRLRDEYWLYVVILSNKPKLYLIQDPASKLKPNEEVEIVRYVVNDWKDHVVEVEVGS